MGGGQWKIAEVGCLEIFETSSGDGRVSTLAMLDLWLCLIMDTGFNLVRGRLRVRKQRWRGHMSNDQPL